MKTEREKKKDVNENWTKKEGGCKWKQNKKRKTVQMKRVWNKEDTDENRTRNEREYRWKQN